MHLGIARIRAATDVWSRLCVGLGSASGVSTAMFMLLIVPDVLMRSFLNRTIPFASEIAVFLLICKIYLGMAGAQASLANFHVTLLLERLSPRSARYLNIVSFTASLVFVALLAWYCSAEAVRSTLSEEAIFVGAKNFAIWPQRIIVAIGLVLLAVQLALQLLRICLGLPPADRESDIEGAE